MVPTIAHTDYGNSEERFFLKDFAKQVIVPSQFGFAMLVDVIT